MLERPWPIVEPTATEPAVAAICASIPGPLDCVAACAWGGTGGACDGWGAVPGWGAAAVCAGRVCWGAGVGAGRDAGRLERDERWVDENQPVARWERTRIGLTAIVEESGAG